MTKQSKQYRLMEAIGFDETDLAANREGTLSLRQQSKLRHRYNDRRFTIIAFLIFGTGFAGYAILTEGFKHPASIGALVVNVLGIATIGLLYMSYIWLLRGGKISLVGKPTVATIEGLVNAYSYLYKEEEEAVEQRIYHLDIGGKLFTVTQPVFEAFENGGNYRVYYIPAQTYLLAAEPMAD